MTEIVDRSGHGGTNWTKVTLWKRDSISDFSEFLKSIYIRVQFVH